MIVMFTPKEGFFYQCVENNTDGHNFAVFKNGLFMTGRTEDVLATFMIVNKGDVNQKTAPLSLKQWESVNLCGLNKKLIRKAKA